MQHRYIEKVYEYAKKKRDLLIPFLKVNKQVVPEHFLYPPHLVTDEDQQAFKLYMRRAVHSTLRKDYLDVITQVDAEMAEAYGDLIGMYALTYAIEVATYFHGDPEAEDHVRKGPGAEPYITHPLVVYDIITESTDRYNDFTDPVNIRTLVATILHDTIEGTKATVCNLSALFGRDAAFLVCGCSKPTSLKDLDLPLHVFNPDHTVAEHYANGSEHVQNIKTADAIHNVGSFMSWNPEYAPVYASKKSKLHRNFTKADKKLHDKLMSLIHGKALC